MAKKAKTAKKKKAKALKLPAGFKRPRSIAGPQGHSLAASATTMAPLPHICVPTGPPGSPCLKYTLDPTTGEYSVPRFGELMDCATCRGGG
jgi:hypothetical protein